MIERRRYPRFELKVDATYSIISSEELLKRCRTRNISAEGLCFEADKRLITGTLVELKIDLKDDKPPISVVGETRWSQESKDSALGQKRFATGIKLINIPQSDEGRFLKYYCDRMVEKLSDYLKL